MINKVILLGNLGKDPEVRYFDNGTAVASFSLATNETFKNKQGEKQTLTEWHNVTLFGKLAEIAEKHIKKGDSIYIEGKIKTEKHNEKYYTKVVVNEFGGVLKMLGSKSDNSQGENISPVGSAPIETDDLPF